MQILAGVGGGISRVSVAGYAVGGQDVTSRLNRLDKVAFPSDTKSTSSATLSNLLQNVTGFADSGVAGYSAGGDDPSVNVIDKIAFPSDTKSTLSATTSSIIYSAAGFANSGVAGYIAGGHNDTSGLSVNRVDKIAFPSDTKSTISGTLTTIVRQPAGFSNTGVAGYVAGGSETTNYFNRVDKIAFPADTKSTISGTLTSTSEFHCGFADYGVAGYVAGGQDAAGTGLDRIDRIAFPSDTKSTLGATLTSINTSSPAGFADTGVAGYIAGSFSTVRLDRIDKISFPGETKSTLVAVLTTPTRRLGGFADCGVL